MRIDSNVTTLPVNNDESRRPTTRESAPLDRSEAAVVELSSAASAVAAEPPANELNARLDRIKALVDAGNYPVDLDKLAERIVDDDILRSTRRTP